MEQYDKIDLLSGNIVEINDVNVSAYKVPTDSPESDGTLKWDSTTIIIVEISAGNETGIGYSYSEKAAAVLIKEKLSGVIKNQNTLASNYCCNEMLKSVRNIGSRGIAASAISAVDCALWDLKSKLLNMPLVTLLGQVRNKIEIYGSGGFTSYSINQLKEQLGSWTGEGISKVKMKVGREPVRDPDRVKAARDAVGTDAEIFVDANGAYTPKQAIVQAEKFMDSGISWFEEPVSSDDIQGLKYVKNKAAPDIQIAAGEYGYETFYFKRMLDESAVDVLQADATRCLGITGFIKAAQLCEAYNIPLSAHTAPSIHLHPCCALLPVKHIEYFHDHVRIESKFFDGFVKHQGGYLFPDLTLPGLGISLRRNDVEEYLVYQ